MRSIDPILGFHPRDETAMLVVYKTMENGSTSFCILTESNRPFPSSCLPPLQSESKCEVFVMVISATLRMNEN